MDKTERMTKSFVGYEYKEIHAEGTRASFLLDGYECFGWEEIDNIPEKGIGIQAPTRMIIRLRRNRKIINKMELTRLQRNFEACVKEIDMLENSKTSLATIYAIIVGIVGSAFMAASVFAITMQPPQIVLCIVFAIPAFIGWLLPYFLYKRTVRKQTEKLTPIIEEKFDEIYELCEKGTKLLH